MLTWFRKWLISKRSLTWRLAHGHASRGRTSLEPSGDEPSSGMGNAVIQAHTELTARHLRKDANGEYQEIGRREVRNRVVTTVFVEDIVDNLIAEVSAFGDYKFHGSGTGVGGEVVGDTTLGTEVESRDTGTQVEASANQYRSVATHTYGGGFAITEHGLFNIVTAGILMDRTVLGAINVIATDQIEFTFTITFTAGG